MSAPLTFARIHEFARHLTHERLGDERDPAALSAATQQLFDSLTDEAQDAVWARLGERIDRLNDFLTDPAPESLSGSNDQSAQRTMRHFATGCASASGQRRDDLTEAIRAVPLGYVVETLICEAVPPGGVLACPLPQHDDREPSFKVYPDHFHCYGCGAHGDAFDFAAALWGLATRRDFPKVRDRLADELLGRRAA